VVNNKSDMLLNLKAGLKIGFVLFYIFFSFFSHELFHALFAISTGGKVYGFGHKLSTLQLTVLVKTFNPLSRALTIVGGSLGNVIMNLTLLIIIVKKKKIYLSFGFFIAILSDLAYWASMTGDANLLFGIFGLSELVLIIISISIAIMILVLGILYFKWFNGTD